MKKFRAEWMQDYLKRKEVWAWAFYDWANSAFATTVIAGFFPLFFADFYNSKASAAESSALLAYVSLTASLLVAALAPFLAAVAELKSSKKLFLLCLTLLGAGGTAGLALIAKDQWLLASITFGLASIGFSGSLVFYDAFLKSVARDGEEHEISGFGFGLGYLGGGLLFALNVWMFSSYETFGLSSAQAAVKAAFLSVALWWFLFSLPLFRFVTEAEDKLPQLSAWTIFFDSIFRVYRIAKEIFGQKQLLLFLLGYWLYIDGVNSVIRLAISFGRSLVDSAGVQLISSQDLVSALLLTQFVAFPAAIFFGWLGRRFGAVRGICIGIAVYFLGTVWAAQMSSATEFYLLACVIGLVQGGVQALSRSYFAQITPTESAAEYFSFYNIVGKFASILGPGIYALVIELTGSARLGILGLLPLFFLGAVLLLSSERLKRKAEV